MPSYRVAHTRHAERSLSALQTAVLVLMSLELQSKCVRRCSNSVGRNGVGSTSDQSK